MSELFTVKLDLSSVSRDENDKLYILMVDPARMKMIFQFKLWVRFLFSIQCPIKLLYEDAALHDMEDIHILNILKTVRVEFMYYGVGEKKHLEELVAKVNKYDEWHESILSAVAPQKQCELLNRDGFDMSSCNIQQTGVTQFENLLNLSNEGCERRNENAVQYSECNGSQTVTKTKSGVMSNNLNTSSNSCSYNGDETIIANYYNKTNENIHSEKEEHSNEVLNTTPKIMNDSGIRSCSSKQKSSFKTVTNKPFSLYNFLQSLKSQESKTENSHKLENDVQLENNDIYSSQVKVEANIRSWDEDGKDTLTKRKRKRVRKPRNQRIKNYSQSNVTAELVTSPVNDKQINKLLSISPKPKHIRFDTDEEENRDSELSKSVHKSVIMKDDSNECVHNLQVAKSADEKFDEISSAQQADFGNERNNVTAATIEVVKDSPGNEVDTRNQSMNGDGIEAKSDSPQRILDILGSLKSKSNTPPVFNRFVVNYM